MCVTSGLCVAGVLFIQVILLLSSPGETPLTYQAASAYLLSFAFIVFCFFGRVSSTLTSLALTILHRSNYCHVESRHPHHKHTILPEYSVRQCAYGGGGGNRTHVHNNFQTTSTNYFNIKSIATTPTANAQAPI